MKAAILLVAVVVAFAVQAQALEVSSAILKKGSCESCKERGKHWYCPSNGKCSHYHIECAVDCHSPCETTKACGGCHSGSNCTCGQCAEDGYNHYCQKANECYHSKDTCIISCGHSHDCSTTNACMPPASCSATQIANCTGNSTCCLTDQSEFFCAPPNSMCCGYKQMTCTQGQICDPPSGKCLDPPPTPPPHCSKCEAIVKHIEQEGCAECAKVFPSYAWLCALVMKLGLCKYIQTHALPPLDICEMIGFCGKEGCSCGYCRPQLYGQWCLSLPNRCPSGAEQVPAILNNAEPKTFNTVAQRDSHYETSIRRLVKNLDEREEAKKTGLGNFCVDGVCEASKAGCCLTCAP